MQEDKGLLRGGLTYGAKKLERHPAGGAEVRPSSLAGADTAVEP